ncbi:MAG: arylesterase [Verrucomicrobiota bacterium]|nr:arylesterase [Chthoniobacterales bacterium]MDQ3414501.1 arylesterase [Verrucomicrobiota bacterium]
MRNLTRRIPILLALLLATPAFGGTILFLGDSLTAGLGVSTAEAYPALIEQKIQEKKLPFSVINAGISGDTTAGGLARLEWVLQKKIDVLVIALGANDGLRGLPVAQMKTNLQAMIEQAKAKNPEVKIVIAGMRMPSNLGGEYSDAFQKVFADLAQENNALLIPFLLEGVGGHRELNQADQMHPTAAGHKIIAENVWRVLEPFLTKSGS